MIRETASIRRPLRAWYAVCQMVLILLYNQKSRGYCKSRWSFFFFQRSCKGAAVIRKASSIRRTRVRRVCRVPRGTEIVISSKNESRGFRHKLRSAFFPEQLQRGGGDSRNVFDPPPPARRVCGVPDGSDVII